MNNKKQIGIVVQRWHETITGGAESLAWQYAQLLKNHYDVHLITTTALSSDTWANELNSGEEHCCGVKIIRFEVTSGRSEYWKKLHYLLVSRYNASQAEPIRKHNSDECESPPDIPWSIALQEEWIRKQGPHSQGLIDYLETNQAEYQAIILITYLYSPAYFGSFVVEKSRLLFVPTLHDEPPAYLSAFKFMAKRAKRLLWNTGAERELIERLWGNLPGRIVSMGIETSIQLKPDFPDIETPFLLYSGRIDPGKGSDRLFEYFLKYKSEQESPLFLYLTGSSNMRIPGNRNIKFLGFVSEKEKLELMSRAAVFIMPSRMESLSVVTLEAMAQKTPVLVNGNCPVLEEHIKLSEGGKAYYSYESFKSELDLLLTDQELRTVLGDRGRKYVIENYSEERVREKLIEEIEDLKT